MRTPIRIVPIAALLGAAGPAFAQTPSAAKKLPSAAEVMQRSIQATGGSAWNKLQGYTLRGAVSLPAQGNKGEFTVEVKVPHKIMIRQDFASLGNTAQGFDGSVGWAKETSKEARSLTGPELAALKQQATLALRPGRWKELYSSVEVLGMQKVARADAYRVRLKPKSGDTETRYFDVKSGLEVRADLVASTPQGKIPVEVYSSDYRTVDGIRLPFKLRQIVGPTELVMQISEARVNASIADADFASPK